jgi:hypothetical protein
MLGWIRDARCDAETNYVYAWQMFPGHFVLALRSYLGNRGSCGVIVYSGCTDTTLR